jgi:hypothetical protein
MDAGYGQALYFPYIHLTDEPWLKVAALYYDSISRIVPFGYEPHDSEFVGKLKTQGQFIRDLNPINETLLIQDEFLAFAERYLANETERKKLRRMMGTCLRPSTAVIHANKFEMEVLYRLSELGLAEFPVNPNEEWHILEPVTGAIYMTFLADRMAERRGLPLLSDDPAFDPLIRQFHREESSTNCDFALASLVITTYLPCDLGSLDIDRIIEFRTRSELQRLQFYEAIRGVSHSIREVDDPRAYEEQLRRHQEKIDDAVADLELCFLNCQIAYATTVLGVSVPAWAVSASSLSQSGLIEVAVGATMLAGISIQKGIEWHRTRKNSPWSYVLAMRNQFERQDLLRSLLRGELLL